MLHFGSSKNKKRPLLNEFSSKDNQMVNPEILKTNWYPAADFLVRRFVKNNKSYPMCNLSTVQSTELPQPEIPHKLITRIKKSSSIVVNIKAVSKNETPTEKKEVSINRKAKQIINQLKWEESNFENTAAICTFDGKKLETRKSKIKYTIRAVFQ